MLDPVTVAGMVTPFLVKAVEVLGEKVWDKTSESTADEVAGFGRRVLGRLLHRAAGPQAGPAADGDAGAVQARTQRGVVEAVQDLIAAPADQDVQAGLRLAVRKLLATDPALMTEVTRFVQDHAPAPRAGDRSIQIGGAQSGGVNVTGDRNDITYGGPGRA